MQEKSSIQTSEQWETPIDLLVAYIRKHDDLIVGSGVGLAIGLLIGLTIITCVTV
jgi:hypothetical protein